MTLRISKFLLAIIFTSLLGCQDDEDVSTKETAYDLQGYVQKGPFINGTAITVSELNDKLIASGKNFTTQIIDNKGSFSLKDITLQSNFVQLIAEGFYFDEVRGEKSAAQLTLFALADVSNVSSVNVNLLSHLEKDRVIYLMQEEELSFATAKKQAQQEILAVFGFEKTDMAASELLDISQEGDDNAILLAISAILQGWQSVAELSELVADIITDIREDGVLDSESSQDKIRVNAMSLELADIRQHLEVRYEKLGVDATIPNFEQYILSNPSYIKPLKAKTKFPGTDYHFFSKVSFAIDHYVYAGSIADWDLDPKEVKKFFRYDLTTDQWMSIAGFPGDSRNQAVSFVADNKAYIGMGQNDQGNLNDLWAYDPELNQWVSSTPCPGESGVPTAILVIDDNAYIRFEKSAWRFDASTGIWNQIEGFQGDTPYNTFSFKINKKGYVGTVRTNDATTENSFWEYEPDANQWMKRAPLPFENEAIGPILSFSIADKGYFFTGFSSLGYEYDPNLNEWSVIEIVDRYSIFTQISTFTTTTEKGYLLDHYNHFWEFTPPKK